MYLFFELFIGGILGLFAWFINNIVSFESAFIGLMIWAYCDWKFNIHPAFSLLLGVVAFVVLMIMGLTRKGFVVLTFIGTLFWSYLVWEITYSFANGDLIWAWVITGICFVIFLMLHRSVYVKIMSEPEK